MDSFPDNMLGYANDTKIKEKHEAILEDPEIDVYVKRMLRQERQWITEQIALKLQRMKAISKDKDTMTIKIFDPLPQGRDTLGWDDYTNKVVTQEIRKTITQELKLKFEINDASLDTLDNPKTMTLYHASFSRRGGGGWKNPN